MELPEGCRFFGYSGALYALCGEKLLRCSRDFQERVYPMLSIGSREMKISLSDLPAFCNCVLPEVRDWVCMEDPDRLLQQYAPEECTPRYYFDLDEDRLLAELRFRYGEREVPYGPAATQDLSVKRNARQEQAALAPCAGASRRTGLGFSSWRGKMRFSTSSPRRWTASMPTERSMFPSAWGTNRFVPPGRWWGSPFRRAC